MSSASQQLIALFILPFLLVSIDADKNVLGSSFLGRRDSPMDHFGHADLLASLEKLENVTDFDHGAMIAARTQRLEAAIDPLFRIGTKDAEGRVDAKEARYLLHRLFAQRHGWFVNGIELHEGLMNTSQVGKAFFSGGSFSKRQLARFAATLETLVHAENIERLQKAFDVYGYTRQELFSKQKAKKAIVAYMVHFLSIIVPKEFTFKQRLQYVETGIADWADTRVFATEVMQQVLDSEPEPHSLWNFTERVVDEIGERYGRWQNMGCLKLKSELMEMEAHGSGRVPLGVFWEPILHNKKNHPFVESIPFLDQLGALDETNSSVVIPNYIYAASNCLAGSKYYDVCCINECEAILGDIESQVNAPSAPSKQLASIVANLGSSTVDAPRELSPQLVERLDAIALQHRGVVPLHGRLFFQFLHHAYPRECPYPKHSLTETINGENFIKRWDEAARVSYDVVLRYVEREEMKTTLGDQYIADAAGNLPWSDQEELFMHSLHLEDGRNDGLMGEAGALVPFLGLVLAAGLFVFPCRRSVLRAVGVSEKAIKSSGYYV
eukprot:TRINITY_DN2658_c0_g2_i1.p1 TRINITY_DN2658_c0_g2~~TRINITY_DN2658_c0_g2_i1.p1  ORF type:complete len:552 (+),score=138.13 TRINITY_DN2658_c0_g2_i1:77-1732(+)